MCPTGRRLGYSISRPTIMPQITYKTLKEGFLIDLRGAAEKSSTVRFRVYDLAVKFSLLGAMHSSS